MTRKTPTYLKLHVEDGERVPRPSATALSPLADLAEAFRAVTGWQLALDHSGAAAWSMTIDDPAPYDGPPGPSNPLATTPDGPPGPSHPRSPGHQIALVQDADGRRTPDATVVRLAQSVGQLVGELQRARVALWEREAELATAIPVSMHAEDPRQLAERLELLLRGGAEAVACQAAALYLLDDATSHLKLRASWGLPGDRFAEPPRSLRHSIADLEALVGHAVVMDDVALLPHWNAPEGFASAVCVPVASASMLLGTLWIFSDRQRDFSPTETHLIEIVAGRIVAELEREILWREQLRTSDYRTQIHQLSQWRRDRMPTIEPPLDGWQVAGWTSSGRLVESGFYDWLIRPDGSLCVAAGWSEGEPVAAALASATVQTALKAHADHGSSAAQVVELVNQSLIASAAGTPPVSLFYGSIDPATNRMEYVLAGRTLAVVCRARNRAPLESSHPPLGENPDARYTAAQRVVGPKDVLIVSPDAPDRRQLLESVRPRGRGSATQWITSLRRQIESAEKPAVDEALLVLRRR